MEAHLCTCKDYFSQLWNIFPDSGNVVMVRKSFTWLLLKINCKKRDLFPISENFSIVKIYRLKHSSLHLRTGFPLVENNLLTNRNIYLLVETTPPASGNTFSASWNTNFCSKKIIYITLNETQFITERNCLPLLKTNLLDCRNKRHCL